MPPDLLQLENARQRARTRPKVPTALTQARQMQDVLFKGALDPDIKPLERSSLARVWCELEETKRKLRMKPLPKAIDVQVKSGPGSRKRKAQASFEEPGPTTGSVPGPGPEQSKPKS